MIYSNATFKEMCFAMCLWCMLIAGSASAQSNTLISDDATYSAPHASAVLDIYSTSKGLLAPRLSTAPASPTAGLMYYNTSTGSYWFYNGTNWREIGYEQFWARFSPTQVYTTDVMASYGFGTITPNFQVHINDPGLLGGGSMLPQLMIENSVPNMYGPGHISIGFIDNVPFIPNPFVLGVDRANPFEIGTFKLQATSQLMTAWQGDQLTIFRGFPNGIVDLNNQSRARAWQNSNPHLPVASPYGQPIAPGVWTPVFFDQTSYDQHAEFARLACPPVPASGGPAGAFFKATQEGYYQVDARVDFAWKEYMVNDLPEILDIPTLPIPGGYVSIAIVLTDAAGNTTMYAQGNKLQGHSYYDPQGEAIPQNGLAPNVSDVVYCGVGDRIEIWVWQSVHTAPIPLRVLLTPPDDAGLAPVPAPTQVYVTVHKVS